MNRTLKLLAAAGCIAFTAIPAKAAVFYANMSGASEVPPVATTASGFTLLTLTGDSLQVDITWTGLLGGNPSAAHIHCCIAPGTSVGVAVGFPDFPTTTSGNYSNTFDLLDPSIYTAGFLNNFGGGTAAGAEAALVAALTGGQGFAYTNIHNATWPGGEIRGLIFVPEPATLALFGVGLIGFGFARRKSKKS